MVNKQNENQTLRRHQRRTSYIIVEYTVKEGVFRDIIKNIGAKGLFVRTKRTIAEGQEIKMKFPLFRFDHVIQARGEVVRSTPSGFAVTFDTPIQELIGQDGELPPIVHEIERIQKK
jgi:hypothetical protein